MLKSRQNPPLGFTGVTVDELSGDEADSDDENEQLDADLLNKVKIAAKQNRLHFPLTVKAGMRFGCSSRGIAAITTCTLVDLGVVTKSDPHLIVDHHKVEREKERVIKKLVTQASDNLKIKKPNWVLYDGKKDLSMTRLEVEGSEKVYHGMQREEHISVCTAEGLYLTHFVPNEPTESVPAAQAVADELLEYLK